MCCLNLPTLEFCNVSFSEFLDLSSTLITGAMLPSEFTSTSLGELFKLLQPDDSPFLTITLFHSHPQSTEQ